METHRSGDSLKPSKREANETSENTGSVRGESLRATAPHGVIFRGIKGAVLLAGQLLTHLGQIICILVVDISSSEPEIAKSTEDDKC
jgi:hypothetical protein